MRGIEFPSRFTSSARSDALFLSTLLVFVGGSLASPPALTSEEVRLALADSCDHADVEHVPVATKSLVRLDRDLPAPKLAVSMEITKASWIVDGEEVSMAPGPLRDKLDAKAETARDLASLTGHPAFAFAGEMLLFVAPDVPASTLSQVFTTAHRSGYDHLSMVVRLRPNPEPAFADPAYAAELIAEQEALMRATSQRMLSVNDPRRAERDALMARCPDVAQAMEAVAAASAELKCEMMVRGLTEALPSCGRADGVKILTGMQVVARPAPWKLGVVALHIDPEGTERPVEPDATWADVAPLWADLPTTPSWFVAKAEADPPRP